MKTKLNLLTILTIGFPLFLLCSININAQSQNNQSLQKKELNKIVPVKVNANNSHQFSSSGNTDCQGKITKIESKCEAGHKRARQMNSLDSETNNNCQGKITKIESVCDAEHKRAKSQQTTNNGAVTINNEVVNVNGTPITIVKTSSKNVATQEKGKSISSPQTNSQN